MPAQNSSTIQVDNDDSSLFDVQTNATGPTGSLPLDEEFLRNAPSGDIFGLTQDAGMGWSPRRLRNPRVPHPQHAGRHPRPGRHAHRPRLPYRPLGGRPADGGRGRKAQRARHGALCRFRHRPL